ncbi:UNVERIFIED_CONTAM: hypothetical protein GTU68_031001 [Idotea baltica]|nr:hypothetical protein [Idotea baltica]
MLDAGVIKIAWYGMMWAMSFMIGYYLISYFFKLEKVPIKWLDSLVIYLVLGSVIGARLGHCFFYEWDYYTSNPLEIIFINKGGMASHGGAIGIILVLFFWSRRVSKRSILWILDRVVIGVAIAGVLIRFGNFVNQEIVGAPSDSSIAVVFPRHDQNSEFRARPYVARHPAQLYEAAAYLPIFIFLLFLYFRQKGRIPLGQHFGLFLILIFTARFFIEFIKENQEAFEDDLTYNMGQLLSIPFVLAGIFFLIRSRRHKPGPHEEIKEEA